MKREIGILVFILLLLGATCLSSASENATKNDCIAKTKQAAKMIGETGLEATLKEINNKKGAFVWKDSYVFAIEAGTAKMLAHPYVPPKMLGKSFLAITDKRGKAYFKEFLKVAEIDGKGWVSYAYPNPKGVLSKKVAYVLLVPGNDVILIAGIYSDKASESTPSASIEKKVALVLCFSGFDDNEYHGLKKTFDHRKIQSVAFSSEKGLAKGMHGTTIQVNRSIAEFDAKEFEAAIFIGGRGLAGFLNNPKVHKIANSMVSKGKILAANYWAPVILANAGVLNGKKATVTPIEADTLKKHGVDYIDKILAVDGNVITGNGSAAVELYADLITAKILVDTFTFQ